MKCRYCSRLMTKAEVTHTLYGPEQYRASCLTINLVDAGYTLSEAHYNERLADNEPLQG